MTAGAVLGAVGGFLVGRISGSFIRSDTWVDAPDNWAVRYSDPGPTPTATVAEPEGCPSFVAD
jgi:hypothetical protein